MVHGHFHGLGLFIPKIITPRKMLACSLLAEALFLVFADSRQRTPGKEPLLAGKLDVNQGVNFYFRRKRETAISPPKFSLFQYFFF